MIEVNEMSREEYFKLATLCEELYGIQNDIEEEFFVCAECGEPLYYSDWLNDEDFIKGICPICYFDFIKGE